MLRIKQLTSVIPIFLPEVTIESKTYKGVFIYPDNYNGNKVSSSMTWDQINAAGIVFLPAAGLRYDSNTQLSFHLRNK